LPLQHINDGVLRRMARRVSRHDTLQLIDRLRTGIANLTLRTTFITGFPGETDAAFDELAAFVRRQRFERMGVFSYSREENTPADRLGGHVPEATREERRQALMEIQQRIAFAANEAQIGQRKTVLVDRPVPDAPGAWIARSAADAPDIDGLVFLTENDQHKLSPGAMTECEIVTFQEYDLIAVATGTPW
ncbi:MAG: radical SAM protein, partial [Planctomycetes bacterium]|nr:radical SAM protein [Planctomycetota bacterium]